METLYHPCAIVVLKSFEGKLPFDVFIERTSHKYTKLFKKGDEVEPDRINKYQDKKINFFYVTDSDYDEYFDFLEKMVPNFFSKTKQFKFNQSETALIIRELVTLTSRELHSKTNIRKETIEIAGNMVHGHIMALKKDPSTLIRVLKLLGQHHYLYRHALGVSILSVILAQECDINSKIKLQQIGLGGFLHDIGISRLPFDPEQKDTLTPEDWKEIKTHPVLGKRILDGFSYIMPEVRTMVLQHHERINGTGYPNHLTANEIFLPAKILAITDGFFALICKRSYRKSFSPVDAFQLMGEEGGYDKKILDRFKKIIFPGSL